MYQASTGLSAAIQGDQRSFKARIKCGEWETTEGIRAVQQYSQSNPDNYISIGGAVSSYVEVEMWKPELQLENKEIEVSIGVLVEGEPEWVQLGLFTAQKPENDDGVIRFTAYDRIQSKMSGAYFSELTYPADGKTVLQEISEKTGVPIDTSGLPDGVMIPKRAVITEAGVDDAGNETTSTTYSAPFDGYLYREALGYVAQFYGKFAATSRAGTVEMRWYTEVDYTIGTSRYYDDLMTNELVFSVTGISCQAGEQTLTVGTGNSIQIENPVMTQERLEAVYEQIKGLQFLPAGLSFLGDIRPDVGDIIKVNDKAGNVIKIPVMYLMQDYDGGLLTQAQSFGRTETETEATKGPTAQKLDRVYTDLFLVKELVGNKASFDYVHAIDADFQNVKADYGEYKTLIAGELQAIDGEFNSLSTKYAMVDLANIAQGAIKTAMIDVGAIQTAQIADGAITNLKVAGGLDAAKITVGTLSVDRLVIRGSEKSIVYQLNNITGALQAQNVDTLNGEILTPRTITADKIVASSITGNEIAAKTITANNIVANSITGAEIAANAITAAKIASGAITTNKLAANAVTAAKIDVTDLFAQDITATGTITGVKLAGATGSFSGSVTATSGTIGGWTIEATRIYSSTTLGDGKSAYICMSNNFYTASNSTPYNPTFGVKYDDSWTFYVRSNGALYAKSADISGKVTATSGAIGGWKINETFIDSSSEVTSGTASTQYEVRIQKYASPTGSAFLVRKREYDGAAYGGWTTMFQVRHDGKMIANDATIKGTITATSGKVGVFNIDSALYTSTNAFGTTANNIYIGSSGISLGTTFKVTNTGSLTATSGTISGWTIGSTSIRSLSSITEGTASTQYDALMGRYAAATGSAFLVRSREYNGSEYGDWTTNFQVRYDGKMIANNASVKGIITATNIQIKDTLYIYDDNGNKMDALSSAKVTAGSSKDLWIGSGAANIYIPKPTQFTRDVTVYGGAKTVTLDTSGNIDATGNITAGGNITSSGNIYLNNYKTLFIKDTSGTYQNVVTLNANNQYAFAAGSYNASAGDTYYNGYRVYLRSKNGMYCNGATTFSSDERLKTDFVQISDSLIDAYMEISPTLYRWADKNHADKRLQIGVKAQEVMRAFEKHGLRYADYALIDNYDGDEYDYPTYTVTYEHLDMITMCLAQRHEIQIREMAESFIRADVRMDSAEAQLAALRDQLFQAYTRITQLEQQVTQLRASAA